MRNEYVPVREMQEGVSLGMTPPISGKRFVRMVDAFKHDAHYWGERGEWYIVAAQHRDSDALTRSNFAVLLNRLGGESDTVAIERANHWAVGWVEYLIVRPDDRRAIRTAIYAHSAEYNYPILDESHFSDLETDEFYAFAKSELSRFDGWEDVFDDECNKSNSGAGDEGAEWAIIEAAHKRLKATEIGL